MTPNLMGSIENTRATFLTLPDITVPVPDSRRPRIVAKGPVLGPGRNTVPDAYLAALEKLDPETGPGKVWASWRRMGYVVNIIRASDPRAAAVVASPEGATAPETLTGIKAEGAVALINAETSMEVLVRWAQSERRSGVRGALQARIQALQTGPGSDPTSSTVRDTKLED